jgi:hypothetical protein
LQLLHCSLLSLVASSSDEYYWVFRGSNRPQVPLLRREIVCFLRWRIGECWPVRCRPDRSDNHRRCDISIAPSCPVAPRSLSTPESLTGPLTAP